jgi:transcriptional regulator with XRE-family HTH domain
MTPSADMVRDARLKAGLSQEGLGDLAKVTGKTVYRLESGERVRPANARAIYQALGLADVQIADTTEQPSAGIRVIATPQQREARQPDTMLGALPDDTQFLLLADPASWKCALAGLSWIQAVRATGARNALLLGALGTPYIAGSLVCIVLGVLFWYIPLPPTDATIPTLWLYGLIIIALMMSAYGFVVEVIRIPYLGTLPEPRALALTGNTLTMVNVGSREMRMRRQSLKGALIDRVHYRGFACYDIYLPNRKSLRIDGVPIDPEFEAALMSHNVGRSNWSVPLDTATPA